MKTLLILSALALPLGTFAQVNNVNPQAQMQNSNYYDQLDINDDNSNIQTNPGNAQANPPAQVQQKSSGSFFGSNENDNSQGKVHCKDCDAVKKALRASQTSSHHRNPFNMKKWGNKFSARMNMKMKKIFAHRKKIKTSYEVCFNWH